MVTAPVELRYGAVADTMAQTSARQGWSLGSRDVAFHGRDESSAEGGKKKKQGDFQEKQGRRLSTKRAISERD